ncbi:flagellar biosynthetic protein FliR [Ideonella sp. 4Y11]|uniref:Flagellar biosynthetic protein FliR n=1 Tax=Ideonella aquatica TaxID=2824119 RepID=A0A940YFM8_9BURK|nr:flagellar biosynthetic protein FliR [Ideonella aquatica]MBQ0958464.1 flagellar biosynthetic protein FliR [Ideonella aquatica]
MISFSEAQILAWITPILWPFVRVLALLQVLPVIGQRLVPLRVRVGLAFLVALAAQPMLPPIDPVPLDSALAVGLLAQQLMIGLTLGFAVRLVVAAVELAGEIAGLQMGLNFAGFFDPVSATQATASSRFFGTLVAFLFIVINGHLTVIEAVVRSLEVFPVGPQPFAFLAATRPHAWGAEVFRMGLWIAMPLIAMLMLVNLVLGVVSRVAPQVHIFSLGFPVTVSVGLIGLMAMLPTLQAPFVATLERMLAPFR